jgi:SAM-dependent methyltransferase
MQNNYDPIARYYDVLSRLVYFRAQLKAQTDQLLFIPANSRILITGGGTGWILEEISKVRPSGLNITYVEISEKMLALTKKRDIKENTITYIHAAAEDLQFNSSTNDPEPTSATENPDPSSAAEYPEIKTNETTALDTGYDIIITAFLFDNFSKDKITLVFDKFDQSLRTKGLWLFSDFYYRPGEGKKWQKYLLKTMYFFFKLITSVETDELINTEHHFKEHFYKQLQVKNYYRGFIKAVVYQKS